MSSLSGNPSLGWTRAGGWVPEGRDRACQPPTMRMAWPTETLSPDLLNECAMKVQSSGRGVSLPEIEAHDKFDFRIY